MKKKNIITLILFSLTVSGLFSFVNEDQLDSFGEMIEEKIDQISDGIFVADNEIIIENDEDFEEGTTKILSIDFHSDEDKESAFDTPYMGVYTVEITLKKARELDYEKNYGVMVTGVISNSPAKLYRIMKYDIIMEIDGQRILDSDTFTRVIKSHYVGDKVKVKLFRDGEEKEIDFIFGSRKKKYSKDNEKGKIKISNVHKHRTDVGDGCGGWIPVWFSPDLEDVNHMISQLGFEELRDDGIFLNGLGGKGNIGKGIFLGGMGVWYSTERKKSHNITENEHVIRKMKFSTSYLGVTIDKRFALSKKLFASLGGMIGWSKYNLIISQTDGDYSWNNLGGEMDSSTNNYMDISRRFILFQPKTSLLFRINDWLSLRGEVGYIGSYSFHNGWENKLEDDNYEIDGSPNTKFDGLTITIGPWFGF